MAVITDMQRLRLRVSLMVASRTSAACKRRGECVGEGERSGVD